MTTSGIVTRGYGHARSTIVTRGYGSIVDVIEQAIINAIPRVRFVKSRRNNVQHNIVDWIDRPVTEQRHELCVSVELVGLHGKHIVSDIKNQICKQLDDRDIRVEVVDINLINNKNTTTVIVNSVYTTTLNDQLEITAVLKK